MAVSDINAKELRDLLRSNSEGVQIIDVREPEEYEIVHIKNSKLIPMREIADRVDEIDWDKQVIFVCRSGSRSKIAAILTARGKKDIKNLKYGIYECYTNKSGEFLEYMKDEIDSYF